MQVIRSSFHCGKQFAEISGLEMEGGEGRGGEITGRKYDIDVDGKTQPAGPCLSRFMFHPLRAPHNDSVALLSQRFRNTLVHPCSPTATKFVQLRGGMLVTCEITRALSSFIIHALALLHFV